MRDNTALGMSMYVTLALLSGPFFSVVTVVVVKVSPSTASMLNDVSFRSLILIGARGSKILFRWFGSS